MNGIINQKENNSIKCKMQEQYEKLGEDSHLGPFVD
jgi:hypothetical protein